MPHTLFQSHTCPNAHTPHARRNTALLAHALLTIGGCWQYANMRDTALTYAPPPAFGGDGTGMANAGFVLPGFDEARIPLGSYPTQLSPWGLVDTAGGRSSGQNLLEPAVVLLNRAL